MSSDPSNQIAMTMVYSGHRGLVPLGTDFFEKTGETRIAKEGEWFVDADGTITVQRGGVGGRDVQIVIPKSDSGRATAAAASATSEGSMDAPWWEVCAEVLPHSKR